MCGESEKEEGELFLVLLLQARVAVVPATLIASAPGLAHIFAVILVAIVLAAAGLVICFGSSTQARVTASLGRLSQLPL